MRIFDVIKISQRNLRRSKLRTFLTVAAVFIGALTLSFTNGVGNGTKAYVNEQLGNVGAKDTLVIQMKQEFSLTSDEVKAYNPDKKIGGSFNLSFLGKSDLRKIRRLEGIIEVSPLYDVQLAYIRTGEEKYEATASQYVDGFTLAMSAGTTAQPDRVDSVSIPEKYVQPLGFASNEDALGKTLTLAYKDAAGQIVETPVTIVGVQKPSLLGNYSLSMHVELAQEINRRQTEGIPGLADNYKGAVAKYDPNFDQAQLDNLKKQLDAAGYKAQTVEEQLGTIGTVINTILIVLNVFAGITLFAATFGIVNTLLMSVNERTSEIGLMKALGAKQQTIFAIFSLEAASIGFWGATFGVVVSMAIGTVVSNVAAHTFLKSFVGFRLVAFPLAPSIGILFGIVVLAFLAGALPSLKASRLDPIKALRYE